MWQIVLYYLHFALYIALKKLFLLFCSPILCIQMMWMWVLTYIFEVLGFFITKFEIIIQLNVTVNFFRMLYWDSATTEARKSIPLNT